MPSLEHAQVPLDGLGHAATAIKLGNYAVAISATLVIYVLGISIYRIWFHPLSKVPGPWWMAISGVPYLFQDYFLGSFAAKTRGLHKKYGNTVRVGPNHLIVDGKVGFADIYAHRPGGDATEFKKMPGFGDVDGHLGLIGAPTRDAHRRQRRLLSHAFSDSAMHEQAPIISYYIDLFIKRLSENAAGGKPVDFLAYLSFVTFDIIGDLALGESFGSLENNKYHFWISNLFKGIVGGSRVRFFRFLHPALIPLGLILDTDGSVKKFRENKRYSDEKAKARLALGAEPPMKNKDIVGIDGEAKMTVRRDFMTYMIAGGKTQGLREEEILSNANVLIAAGSETTATNLSTLFFLLALQNNRAIRDTAAAEVRSLFQREADVNLRAVSQKALPFLHACIEEALRYHPPAAETPPRVSPGAIVDGYYIPKGTSLQVVQIATNHNPENFVEAEYYRPQRFLPKDHPLYDPKFEADNMTAFHPFSTGPRDCIGKNLAYAEMRLIAARVLLRFDVELAPGAPENWLEGQRVFVIWEKQPLMLKLTERTDLEMKG